MTIEQILLLSIVILIIIFIFLIIYLLINNKKHTNNELNNKIISFEKTINELNNHLYDEFNNLSDRTYDRLDKMEDKINTNLNRSNYQSNSIFNNINEKIVKIDEAQKAINDLAINVNSLKLILNDKKARGTFGEFELYQLLANVYGENDIFYQKQYKLSNGYICDAIIFQNNNDNICIDSKFPLENYQKLKEDEKNKNYINAFRNDIKKHIDDIKNKYIIPNETCDIALMFIPAESIYLDIYSNYYDLIEKSYKDKVYLVSPTTLMAYITALKSIYINNIKKEKANEIESLLKELSLEFDRLKQRQDKLYKDFQSLNADFDLVNKTSNKLINKFDRINIGDLNEK